MAFNIIKYLIDKKAELMHHRIDRRFDYRTSREYNKWKAKSAVPTEEGATQRYAIDAGVNPALVHISPDKSEEWKAKLSEGGMNVAGKIAGWFGGNQQQQQQPQYQEQGGDDLMATITSPVGLIVIAVLAFVLMSGKKRRKNGR